MSYTKDNSILAFNNFELEESKGRVNELEKKVDRLMLSEYDKNKLIEDLTRENDQFKSFNFHLIDKINEGAVRIEQLEKMIEKLRDEKK